MMLKQNQLFNTVQHEKVSSNQFDLSFDRKYSTKMGRITPIMVQDCVPGDKFSIKASTFLRFAPLIAPVMHNINVYCHFFFVPNRILWDNWENFITGGEDGLDTSVWPHLQFDFSTIQPSSLHDYLGLPTSVDIGTGGATIEQVSALPHAAYQLIWEEYYRDENLYPKSFTKLVDGLNPNNYSTLRTRAWTKDYFTSALPWTQKGPEAMLPLGTEAPIIARDQGPFPQNQIVHKASDGTILAGPGNITYDSGILAESSGPNNIYINLNDTHYTDLSTATSASIIDLRRAVKLQEWLEKNARGGSRYTELIKAHWGVNSSDARLQRPEYIGGYKQPVNISEVLQTSSSASDVQVQDTPQGNMAGHGISIGSGDWASVYCEEHGYIMGLMTVLPQPAYQQGIPRHFSRPDKFDYFWPEFQHIGEQAILNKELMIGGDLSNDDTFGYTPRYAEYKYNSNTVHGDYKDSLSMWHLGRKFADMPSLNSEFIECDTSTIDARIFAVTDQSIDNLWCHTFNQVKATRKMAVYGSPSW